MLELGFSPFIFTLEGYLLYPFVARSLCHPGKQRSRILLKFLPSLASTRTAAKCDTLNRFDVLPCQELYGFKEKSALWSGIDVAKNSGWGSPSVLPKTFLPILGPLCRLVKKCTVHCMPICTSSLQDNASSWRRTGDTGDFTAVGKELTVKVLHNGWFWFNP